MFEESGVIMSQFGSKKRVCAVAKSVLFTFVPFIIPFILYIPDSFMSLAARGCIFGFATIIFAILIVKFSLQAEREKEIIASQAFDNERYRIARRTLNRINSSIQTKENFLKEETYKVHYNYSENVLLYNPHRYIERVCEDLRSLVSEITDIDLEYICVSFIYQYPTDAKPKWQWITGKEPSSGSTLEQLIYEKDSLFKYLITNHQSYIFCNDKSDLMPDRYYASAKDKMYRSYGSIMSHKLTFRNNNQVFCEAYLTLSTVNKKFYNRQKPSGDIRDLEQLLNTEIIIPFTKILEAELGFLYLRHQVRCGKKIGKIKKRIDQFP